MFDLAGLEHARRVVARAMPPTPQYRWPGLSRLAGCEVWVKHENHTPTGAFKVRGGLVLLDELTGNGALPRKIVTATRGNHVVYVPIGMGSGISGLIGTRDLLGLKTDIVGVVAARAPAMARSFAAGRLVATDAADTFADGVACRMPLEESLDVVRRGAARVVEVDEASIAEAMRLLYRETHNVAEGAGAAAFAGLMQETERIAGRRAGVVLSGGNVDAGIFREVLGGGVPGP